MPEPLEPLTVEDRLTMLEREVASLKMRMEQIVNPTGNWVERISGSLKDLPPEMWADYKKILQELDKADR